MSEKIAQINKEVIKGDVEDITEALWGSKVSPATISELNQKA